MSKHIDEIKEIIAHEGEGRSIDFKSIEYKSGIFMEFLKDVMAMANSAHIGNRYLICGVKYTSDTDKQILGIEGPVTDSAVYAQLINDNIEPEVHFDYVDFDYEGKMLTAFVIYDCLDQPYMLKKAYIKLQAGDSFIRKGSSTKRLMRSDIDRIFEKRSSSKYFQGELNLYFKETGADDLMVRVARDFELPSVTFKKRAEAVIRQKESQDYISQAFGSRRPNGPAGDLALENLTTTEIQSIINSIPENWVQEDQYALKELYSYKLNAEFVNNGEEYVKDLSYIITVEGPESLTIAERIMYRQININTSNGIRRGFEMQAPANLNEGYPNIYKENGKYIIAGKLGDLKHGLPENLFQVPIRLVIANPGLINSEVQFNCKFYGENIQNFIVKTLKVKFI
ncbi:Putative DNA-binding domain-containing protein [Mucilaginibacter gossypiicola]|uniref:Putative DNA-binding domain-containing protein n=1 Tax=Mucilaginibacter gossypiicola TaxID=551995 RepID=A0A1H8LWW3_9SPHI|nr:ATP-binding protein [Mucilaginibacter gossypiicola]SEO09642.1 Putative DNA-binding domain-containing protein [Mucilaginibacter gossypiicola]